MDFIKEAKKIVLGESFKKNSFAYALEKTFIDNDPRYKHIESGMFITPYGGKLEIVGDERIAVNLYSDSGKLLKTIQYDPEEYFSYYDVYNDLDAEVSTLKRKFK